MININQGDNINYTIQENDKTVKAILSENLFFSKRLMRRLEMQDKVLLNGKPVKLNKSVFAGDVLTVAFGEECDEYDAVNIPIDILYEDEELLVVNKPPYIVVHPTKSHFNNTIANGVAFYYQQKGVMKKVRFVNRLDMNTSGIVIIAKNAYVHNELSKQLRLNRIEKRYYAVVEGDMEVDRGTVNEPIARLQDEDVIRIVNPSGKESITHYETIGRYGEASLVRLKLDTGRTHQIRVHMKHIGHPVLGDVLYGSESRLIGRQALHCYEMKFVHPLTKEMITIEAPLPDDMRQLIEVYTKEEKK